MLNIVQKIFRLGLDRWLFKMGDAEPGEVFLNQRRVFIVPSQPGLVFLLVLVVLFIAAINYNLSLGFALTFLLGGCALIDMHLTFRNLAHLYLSAGHAQPVFAGEEAQFQLHLINRRKHARYAIWLGFIGKDLPDLAHAADIAAQSTSTIVLTLATHERGWLPAPRLRLQTRFPLGLLRAWSYWRPDVKALVYPYPEQQAPALPMIGSDKQDGQGHAGHDDFAGIRAYRAGDSIRHLAWRQIARLDAQSNSALVTKHFEGGAASELILDFSQLPRTMHVELRLSRMTRWVLEAEERGLPYAFHLGDIRFGAALGAAHRQACLHALALYQGS